MTKSKGHVLHAAKMSEGAPKSAARHDVELVDVLKPLGLTVTDAAKVLDVARPTLSNLLNENAALTAQMALWIEKAFSPKTEHLMPCTYLRSCPGSQTRGRISVKPFRRRRPRSAV
jgi:addiction module HigA family antidote